MRSSQSPKCPRQSAVSEGLNYRSRAIPKTTPPSRPWIFIGLLAVVLSVGAVSFFRSRADEFRWDLFLAAFHQLNWLWMGAAILFMLLTYAGRAFRWRVMMRPVCPSPHLWRLMSSTAIGFTAITLFGRPGELVRPYLIAKKEGVPFTSQMAVWFLERIYDLLLVLLLFGLALVQVDVDQARLGQSLSWVLRTGGYVAAALGLTCLIVLFVTQRMTGTAQRRILDGLQVLPERARERATQIISAFIGGMSSTRSLAYTGEILGYTLVEWVLIMSANFCFFKSFSLTERLGAVDTLVFVGFVAFGSAVQIPGIGGGFQIAAVVVLTELFGLTLESATGFAIVIWLATYVVIVPIGVLLALREGLRWGSLKQIKEEANQ